MWRLDGAMLAQLHRGGLCDQQEPHGAPGRVQPRLPEGELRAETGIAYDERMPRARCSCSAPRSSWTRSARTSPSCSADGVPFEVLDRAGCIAGRAGAGAARHKFVGGLRLPGDETGDCFKFTNRWPRWRRGGWA
jgi:hypothetical protein